MNEKVTMVIITMVIVIAALSLSAFSASYSMAVNSPTIPKLGSLDGSTSYGADTFSGAFYYSYPISVPLGTRGLNPSFAVSYNSQSIRTPTLIGGGWDINQNYIFREVNATPNNTTDDRFFLVLGGSKHELIYDSNDRFRSKTEIFYLINNKTGTNNINNQYWSVKSPDGDEYTFGYNRESEQLSNSQSYTIKWFLDKVNDTYGNTINFNYSQNPYADDLGVVYPAYVEYNNEKLRRVEFGYEDNLNKRIIFDNGNKVRFSKRLSYINTKFNGSLVRRVQLNYVNFGGISSLSSIVEYGADNSTSLQPISFIYYNNSGWTNQNDAWNLSVAHAFQLGDGSDSGIRLIDVNGDAVIDLIKRQNCVYANCSYVLLNNGTGWSNDTGIWNISINYSFTNNNLDNSLRLLDVNGDGKVDIIKRQDCSNCAGELINTGRGWNETHSWDLPQSYSFVVNSTDQAIDFADLNGDGLTDIIKRQNCSNVGCTGVLLNNGGGWTSDSNWELSSDFALRNNGVDLGVRFVDINGDGLPDVVKRRDCSDTSCSGVMLNTGYGWQNDSIWLLPIDFAFTSSGADTGVRLIDLNGDGLLDLIKRQSCSSSSCSGVLLNNGSGWAMDNGAWNISKDMAFVSDQNNNGVRITDVNGDGLPDFIKREECTYSNCSGNWRDAGFRNYLIKTIRYPFGGTIVVDYAPSSTFDNAGGDNISDLPVNIDVVLSIQTDNGLVDNRNVQGFNHYTYFNGKYSFKRTDSQFRGFGESREISPSNNNLVHRFHQSDELQGVEYSTEEYSGSTTLMRVALKNFTVTNMGKYYVVTMDKVTNYEYDGLSNPRISSVDYAYDNFTNVISVYNNGDLGISGDESLSLKTYNPNTTSWILNNPQSFASYDRDNRTILRQMNFTYSPKSDPVIVVRYLPSGNVITTNVYDSFGNVISKTDGRGYVVNYTYDDNVHRLVTSAVNYLGHISTSKYNFTTGALLESIDANGHSIKFSFDVLGRIKKVVNPYDTVDSPTIEYTYNFDGVAPENIQIKKKIDNSRNITDNYYFDGKQKLVQTKTPAENGLHITQDYTYDSQNRLNSSSTYYHTSQNSYSDLNITNYYTKISFDSVNRPIKISKSDGSSINASYVNGVSTFYDEMGRKIIVYEDVFGKITKISEFIGQNTYNTSYSYDSSNQLSNITDAEGNLIKYGYDALGRKTSILDSDIGNWTYSFDASNNIISQKDNRNNTISMQYDGLDRLILKNSSGESIVFEYDSTTIGPVSRVLSQEYNWTYLYDQRLRKTRENLSIDGMNFITTYQYNSMDQVTSKVAPNGNIVTYTYNTQGLLDSIPGVISNLDYNQFNNPTARVYANGLTSTMSYDIASGRLQEVKTGNLQHMNFSYDNVGNVLSVVDGRNGAVENFTYDSLDRLQKAEKRNLTGTLIYSVNYSIDAKNVIRSITTNTYSIIFGFSNKPVHAPSTVTISNSTSGLSISNIQPYRDINVKKGKFFAFTAKVCCEQASSCGTVNVSLDPIPESVKKEFDFSSVKECNNVECAVSYFNNPKFGFEDGMWKPIKNLKSFKGTVPIECQVQSDGIHIVDCLDYNYTHRKLRIRINSNETFNVSIPVKSLKKTIKENGIELIEDLSKRRDIVIQNKDEVIEDWFEANYNDDLHIGDTSTNVSYIPTGATSFSGAWESTSGSLAIYGWNNCDANNYSASDKSAISDGNTATSIYGEGGGSGSDYTYCHWMKWQINQSPSNISSIWSYAYWTGSLSGGADSITKALYIGDVVNQKWEPLHTQTSAWSDVNHSGSVSSNIGNYIESNVNNYYIYTLLHYNASKAGSTYAYSNFYDTELRITVPISQANQSSQTKGLVSTSVGATPFYTNSSNPNSISLGANQCQNVTWWVNATGNENSSHIFFAYANKTSDMGQSARTSNLNVTIKNFGTWIIYNFTFINDNEGFTGYDFYSSLDDGYIESRNDFGSDIVSPNLALSSYTNLRHVIRFRANDSHLSKIWFNTHSDSRSGGDYLIERVGSTNSWKYEGGTFPTIGDIPFDSNITATINFNFNTNKTNSSLSWPGVSGSTSSQSFTNSFNNYAAYDPGDLTGYDRIYNWEVWNLD